MKLLTLDLERELPRAARFNSWPFIDLCVIGVFVAVFGSKFVVTPGMKIDLPQVERSEVSIAAIYHVVTIDEVGGKEMILLDDSILNLETLEKQFRLRGKVPEGAVLLVKAEASVTAQTLFSVSEIASNAGYKSILLADEEREKVAAPYELR